MIYNKVKLIDNKLEYFKQPSNILGNAPQYAIDEGYKDLIYPTLLPTQMLGNPIELEDHITFEVIAKSVEQIIAEKLSEARMAQEEAIKEFQLKEIQEKVQEFDDDKSLEHQPLYPFWEPDIEVQVNKKYQHFNSENELVLYKVIQAHTTQENYKPKDTPALFVRVGYDGEILDWVRPTGAHDAYMKGDKVKFNGKTYESLIDNNVYSPTKYARGWKEL